MKAKINPKAKSQKPTPQPWRAKSIALLALLCLLAAPALAPAQSGIPAVINYQGKLTDNLGSPVASGSYTVEFRVWDHATQDGDGNYIWGRSFPVHVTSNGMFNVLLSDNGGLVATPAGPKATDLLTAFDGADRYLGLTIAPSTTEISPRQRLATAPYAIRAWNATVAGNLINNNNSTIVSIVNSNVGINKTTPGSALDVNGTITATNFSGSGSSLTSLNANNLSSGTVPDARLSANVAKLNAGNNLFAGNVTVGGNMQIGTHNADYQHLQLGGGNSWGYLYGSYSNLSDGIHLGYNYYEDETGQGHVFNAGGGTSRLTVGYGRIWLATGGANTAPATRLFVNDTGNVGLGTTTPRFPLAFPDTLGDKISLFGQSINHYGLGIQNNTLQIHGDTVNSRIVFGYGQSTNLTETMRIQGDGKVGIGTTTPAGMLDVNGTIKVRSQPPIVIRRYALPNPTTQGPTYYDPSAPYAFTNWSAAVIGFTCGGDFAQTSAGDYLLDIAMQKNPATGGWRVQFDVRHHSTLYNINVDVMYIRKELADDSR